MKLVKYHGLGNDYLVLHDGEAPSPALVQALCDRHRGFGADGVLVGVPGGDYGLRIFNPDGSEAEKSGNGLRIFARYLVDHRGAPSDFRVETPGGVVRCTVDDDAVSVEMGRASFEPAAIPLLRAEAIEQSLTIEGHTLRFTALTVGNPHCVIFADPEALPWRALGAVIERHPDFPKRVNVQFARVRSTETIALRIWERGAGETSASGSSACAVAAAAVRTGRVPPGLLRMEMEGGALSVRVDADLSLTLRGPVEQVGELRVAGSWLRARGASTS